MSSLPATFTAYRRTEGPLPLRVEASTEKTPDPTSLGEHDVLLRIHAVSLNFRDAGMLHGHYVADVIKRGIAGSDAGAEVVAAGPAVAKVKVGDRVSPSFFTNNVTGKEQFDTVPQFLGLGGDADGVLAEYAVFRDEVLVKIPDYMSYEEASTIPCAGVTAWTSLDAMRGLDKNSWVLLEGTGGVSMFATLLLIAAGVKTIITSSSDAKLEAVKKLAPELIHGINYKTTPNVGEEAMRISGGNGVNIVINNAGVPTIPDNIASLTRYGSIAMVGFLDSMQGSWNPGSLMGLMWKRAQLRGIGVGSTVDFEELNNFLGEKKVSLKPLIDRTFSLDKSQEAIDFLWSGKHVGKIIVKP